MIKLRNRLKNLDTVRVMVEIDLKNNIFYFTELFLQWISKTDSVSVYEVVYSIHIDNKSLQGFTTLSKILLF